MRAGIGANYYSWVRVCTVSGRKGRGQILNRTEMADHLGVVMTTLDDWVRRGCPVVQRGSRGRPWQFNSADVRAWRDEDIRRDASRVETASNDELRRRKYQAETELVELELARAKDQVVEVEQYERALAKVFGEVRTNLRTVLPERAVRRLLGENEETRFKASLLEEVDQALEALADSSLIFEEDLDSENDDEAPE